MKRIATIILNRNLPEVTDNLYEKIAKDDGDITDIFVVESGSEDALLSKYNTWHANWHEAKEKGLRFGGGMNYGLNEIFKAGKFTNYDAFFLLTNDSEFESGPVVGPLMEALDNHSDIAIISPCGRDWGEQFLFNEMSLMYFWSINFNAYLIRRNFIEDIGVFGGVNGKNFLFDCSNFRGYGTEVEVAAKAYANNWSVAITTDVWLKENHSHLLNKADLIKTEKYDDHLKLYIEEGIEWMRQKYGFKDHWTLQVYAKALYDKFFEFHPSLKKYKL